MVFKEINNQFIANVLQSVTVNL